ncbi:MAG: STAS domain-containing protein [Pseudomonadota bacterium]
MIERENGRLMVRGAVTMETASALYESGLQQVAKEDVLLDFSRAETVDSAAVAMLLAWAKAAQRESRELRVVGLPEGVLSLANLYGVAEMLPHSAS